MNGNLYGSGSLTDQTLSLELPDFSENTDFDLQNKRNDELAVSVNEQLATMSADQRMALIKDVKSRFPKWSSVLGLADANIEELDKALKDTGSDGTFWGSFKMVFRWFDILRLFLGDSTAFGVAYRQGDPD